MYRVMRPTAVRLSFSCSLSQHDLRAQIIRLIDAQTGTLVERVAIDFSRLPRKFRSQIVLGIGSLETTKR